jgi:glycosyltransferase involved in cell wall biosynthesis
LVKGGNVEVTVIFPCLNEEASIGTCVTRAREVLDDAGICGEVLVIDNDSSDRSGEIARIGGARVIVERRRGYGNAYLRGLSEARGEFLVMMDADGTYPFDKIPEFVHELQAGADVVAGNRFGGMMARRSMPFLNRYVGNPILSNLTRLLFRTALKDIHCGMRAIRKSVLPRLGLRTPGMEFATEMFVKAFDHRLRFAEVDIAYEPRVGESKLRPFRDAWRHIEHMLVFSPMALFLVPGLFLYLLGALVQVILLTGPKAVFFRTWDVHTNLAGMAASMTGSTLLLLGVVCCVYAWSIQMRFRHSAVSRWLARHGGATMRAAGILSFCIGAVMWADIVLSWAYSGFGALRAIPVLSLATTLVVSGFEMIGAAFLAHIISLDTRTAGTIPEVSAQSQ